MRKLFFCVLAPGLLSVVVGCSKPQSPGKPLQPSGQEDTTVVVSTPPVSVKNTRVSWNSAAVEVKLTKDRDKQRTVGLLVGDREYPASRQLSKAQSAEIYLDGFAGRDSVRVTPYVYYGDERELGRPVAFAMDSEPGRLEVAWKAVTDCQLPSGVSLFQAVSSVTGSSVNMWYAEVRDLSALKCILESSVCTPETLAGKLSGRSVIINAGYFAAPSTSYSHVTSGGVRKAKNIASLSRTYSYTITRPAFGVDASGAASIRWIADDGSGTTAYDAPLPVIDGERPLSLPAGGEVWKPAEAVGGAPVLLRDGHICFDYLKTSGGFYISNHDLLQSDIFAIGLKAPRTAVGIRADGSAVLFVCDGRNSGGSAGLSLDELARILKGLGCTDAMNLDGGGSSAICVNGKVINHPSDGSSRKVLSFIALQ